MENLKPAMKDHPYSRMLISDYVLPNRNPNPEMCFMDLNMMTIAGKERSEMQWRALLDQAGFVILKVHECEAEMKVIETALKEI